MGFLTTSSTPAANRSSVSSRERFSFMTMMAVTEDRRRMTLVSPGRFSQSPSRNASTERMSVSETALTQLSNSAGASPHAEIPSLSNQEAYPSVTVARSSTTTIM